MIPSTLLAATLIGTAIAAPTRAAPDVRENVREGLKWLADHQAADGHWVGRRPSPKTIPTAYAGLALLMQGSTPSEGSFAPNIRKAVEWFESIAQPSGALIPTQDNLERTQTMLGHSAGLLFLAMAYDSDDDQARRKRLGKLLNDAVKFTVSAQGTSGGWGALPLDAGRENSGTRWTPLVLQSLHATRRAGIAVPREVTERGLKYLETCTNAEGGLVPSARVRMSPMGGDGRAPETASASAAVLFSLDEKPAALPEWVSFTQRNPPFALSEDLPRRLARLDAVSLQHHLHVALTANALGDDGHQRLAPTTRGNELLRWSDYRRQVFGYLKVAQNVDGSWPDATVGGAQATAMALIVLQMDNNYLPAFSR